MSDSITAKQMYLDAMKGNDEKRDRIAELEAELAAANGAIKDALGELEFHGNDGSDVLFEIIESVQGILSHRATKEDGDE